MKKIKLKTYFKRGVYDSNGIKVYQNILYRWLTFNSKPIQTLINRRHPERPLLQYLIPLTTAVKACPGTTCLLGLGGAAAAHMLMPYLNEKPLTIIENNADVISIAKRFFKTNLLKNTTIIHQDAARFISHCQNQYQHLLIDLSDAESFPEHCNTSDFFKNCFNCLNHDGILAINIAYSPQQRSILNNIQHHCGSATLVFPIKASANIVILAAKDNTARSLLNIVNKQHKIKNHTWDSVWGCIVEI